jgi:hypothetical protein
MLLPSHTYCMQQTGGLTRGMTLRPIQATERIAPCEPANSSRAAPTTKLRATRYRALLRGRAFRPWSGKILLNNISPIGCSVLVMMVSGVSLAKPA